MIPERVLEAVAARSGGGSRRVNLSRCPSCGWPALRGADADRCGAVVRVDPVPLTPLGEALALVRGMETFTLHLESDMWVLDYRDPWGRAADPAGGLWRADVVPEHRCGYLWPSPVITDTNLPITVTGKLPDNPPF